MDDPPVLRLVALGTPIDVRCTGPRAAAAYAALVESWSLCLRQDGTAERTLDVVLGEDAPEDPESDLVAAPDLPLLLGRLTQRVTRRAIAANAGRLLMFHAAGLSHPVTGATVVAVAPGGTGKTTLCRTLGPGRGYLSDETVGIGADDRVVSYPKPLSVRRGTVLVKDEVDPRSLGLAPASAPAYVAGVLLLERSDDHTGAPVVERPDLFDAIVGLAPETSSLSRLTRPLHRLADLLEPLDTVVRVTYREAGSLEPLVADVIGAPG